MAPATVLTLPQTAAPTVGHWGYRSYREHLAVRFGALRVRKLCLDVGSTCPNLDGTVGRGGCAWCDNRGFAPEARSRRSLEEQWDRGRIRLRIRHRRVDGFLAYVQAYSNTHHPAGRLEGLFSPLLALPELFGVSIGTRPDCLPEPVLAWLEGFARRTFLTLEIGLQSDRDAVLAGCGRGHDTACFLDAVRRSAGRGFELCAHVILGLPGEGEDAPERLGRLLASLPVQSVKLHNLHLMRGTRLAELHARGLVEPPGRETYLGMLRRLLACLRPDQAVQRLLADAPDRLLIGSPWCHDKQGLLAELSRS